MMVDLGTCWVKAGGRRVIHRCGARTSEGQAGSASAVRRMASGIHAPYERPAEAAAIVNGTMKRDCRSRARTGARSMPDTKKKKPACIKCKRKFGTFVVSGDRAYSAAGARSIFR